jgi:diguanylate cyclase (GGDEF)-like protein/PAS domain S-box-containing protein
VAVFVVRPCARRPWLVLNIANVTGRGTSDRHQTRGKGHLGSQSSDLYEIEGFLSPRALGRLSSALFLLCGALVATGAALLPSAPGSSARAVIGVGVGAFVCGIVIGVLPWGRWRLSATLWLMPVALVCVAAHNVATNADGFRYGLFYMVVFIWLGLGHRPGMAIRFGPLLVAAYLAPMIIVGGESSPGLESTAYAVPTILLMGETVAWVSARVREGEQQVRSSEERFRSLVAHAADVITVVDEDGVILYESPPVTEVLGYRPDERVGTRAADRVHPDDRRVLAGAMARLLEHEDEIVRVEVRVRHVDGSWRWCSTAIRNLLHEPTVQGYVCNSHDVTEQRRAATAMADSEVSFRMLFESNPSPMWVYDLATLAFLEVNDAAVRHYGYTREEFLSKRITDIRPQDDVPVLLQSVRNVRPALDDAGLWRHTLKDGRVIDVDITSHRLTFAGRDAVLVAVHDVTERNQLEQQLRHQAFHDPLTHLANRPLFVDRLEHALAVRRHNGRGIAVLLLDLDRFKTINDSLGHSTGDEALVAIAERLVHCLRPGDTAARLGGDEFVILLEDVVELAEASGVASRIIDALNAPFLLSGRDVGIRASIGIVLHRDGDTTADDLIRNADAAMYAAKASATGTWRVFESSMQHAVLERLELESQLRGAIERDELVLHYQPVVSLVTGETVGFEALVRWMHPDRGLVPPLDFIPIAEEAGLIVPIGQWVLEHACAAAAGWPVPASGEPLELSVNLSARQLYDVSFINGVREIIERTGIAASRLTLEITESVLVDDTDRAVLQLHALKQLGVRIAIDDFGTGYSSLSYLRTFPVDVLKVDKSFIDNVAIDVEGACFVQAILHLAQVLRVTTVAEGIEHAEQADRLRELGCDKAQGYYFGAPAPEVLIEPFGPSSSAAKSPILERS